MKYSFVIPTYNKKELLKKTLEALNHLSGYGRDDYEAVVVDDGSPGPVFKYIKGVNRNYCLNYVYLHRCEDSCRSRTRNYGINVARGQYLAFLDDDIVVNSDYLQQLDRCFRFSDNLVVTGMRLHCPAHLIDSTDIREHRRAACREGKIDVLEVRHMVYNCLSYNLGTQKYPWMMTFSGNLGVPRKLLLETGGFDENFKNWGCEDVELGYRFFKAGAKFVINPKMEAFHQSHPRTPAEKKNFDYFVKKCKEGFKGIDLDTLLSLYDVWLNDPHVLAIFRKYPGKIRNKAKVVLRDESELERVKKSILEFSRTKGCEVIINDNCESTDLDIWVQLLEIKNAVISYFPRSLRISSEKIVEIIKKIMHDKTTLW